MTQLIKRSPSNVIGNSLKIIADDNIPLVKELFSSLGEIILLPGREITPAAVKDAEILLVRSITRVDKNLLANSKVKFVGTPTTGTDHIDIAWLKENNIVFADARGSNATAVAEYVIACVAALQSQNLMPKEKVRAGIIGVGQVGTKVLEKLQALNFTVSVNDPLRSTSTNFSTTSLAEFTELDFICLHTPLTYHGAFPTYHLVDGNFLKKLKKGSVLLNAGRGAVINFAALQQYGQHLIWCLDVWEHEPDIDLSILKQATIATPHIAGYTIEAKIHGALMIYQAAQQVFNFLPQPVAASLFPKSEFTVTQDFSWQEILLQIYNPLNDTTKMRQALLPAPADKIAQRFEDLRKHYPRRHEFASIILNNCSQLKSFDLRILQLLGFNCRVDL